MRHSICCFHFFFSRIKLLQKFKETLYEAWDESEICQLMITYSLLSLINFFKSY